MKERDNLHYSFREIDGYDKDINIVMSAREPGKTTQFWLDKVYYPWKRDGGVWVMMGRHATEFTEESILTIQDTYINDFLPDEERITLQVAKSKLLQDIVDIKIDGKLFFRCVSLHADMRKIKSCCPPNARGAFMDEFIVNPEFKEKYLPNEFGRIQEAYTTWKRACKDRKFKLYFLGNPYSLYNPIFMGLKVDITKLRRGTFYTGADYVVHWALLNPLLREKLLKENPFMKLDEDYGKYALDGYAVNDNHIRVSRRPPGFSLNIVIKIDNHYIGFFKNNYVEYGIDIFHCEYISDFSKNRNVYAFDFSDMVRNTQLFTREDKSKFYRFRLAVGRNLVTYSNAEVYYLVTEIYKFL